MAGRRFVGRSQFHKGLPYIDLFCLCVGKNITRCIQVLLWVLSGATCCRVKAENQVRGKFLVESGVQVESRTREPRSRFQAESRSGKSRSRVEVSVPLRRKESTSHR